MFCDGCGVSLRAGEAVPACPEHGLRWLLARNAPGSEVLVERDGSVLLGRRAVEPHRGRWEIPGWFAPGAWPGGEDLAPWHHERLDDWERVRRGEPSRGLQLG